VFEVKIGIVLQTSDPETAWNAFRFAVTSLESRHNVKVFLLGKGVEMEKIQDKNFDVTGVVKNFLEKAGELYACGTCLEMRGLESKVCPVSTMSQLLEIVEESDKVLVF
jgi:uncharacterized protein involved in oxidation of intracellular sulfur